MSLALRTLYIEDRSVQVFRVILQALKMKCNLLNGGVSVSALLGYVEAKLKVDEASVQDLDFRKFCQLALRRCVCLGFATYTNRKYVFCYLPSRTPPVSCYLHQQYPPEKQVVRKCCPAPTFPPPRCITAPCICALGLHCPCLKYDYLSKYRLHSNCQRSAAIASTSRAQPVLNAHHRRTPISKIPLRITSPHVTPNKKEDPIQKLSKIPRPVTRPTTQPVSHLLQLQNRCNKASKIPLNIRSHVCTMSLTEKTLSMQPRSNANLRSSKIPVPLGVLPRNQNITSM